MTFTCSTKQCTFLYNGMISSLHVRQNGLDASVSWKRLFSTKYLLPDFQLSATRVQQVPSTMSTINCIDLETVESRYILAGFGCGSIAIMDRGIPNNTKSIPIIDSVDSSHSAGHLYSVDGIQWYPHDTGMFVSLSMDRTVKVWDTNEMQVADRFTFQSDVLSFHIRSKGKKSLIAVSSKDKNIYLCDMNTGSKTHTLKGHKSSVLTTKWAPNKQSLLVSASSDGSINLWDVRKSNSFLMSLKNEKGDQAHDDSVNSLSFTHNGRTLLSFGHDDVMRCWNMCNGEEITQVEFGSIKNDTRRSVQMAVTNCLKDDLVFVPTQCDVQVHVIRSGSHVATMSGHFKNVNCCCYCNDFQELFTGSADYKMLVWKYERSGKADEILPENIYQECWSDCEEC